MIKINVIKEMTAKEAAEQAAINKPIMKQKYEDDNWDKLIKAIAEEVQRGGEGISAYWDLYPTDKNRLKLIELGYYVNIELSQWGGLKGGIYWGSMAEEEKQAPNTSEKLIKVEKKSWFDAIFKNN